MKYRDTIVAISTPPGRGGIGVVRLSGSRAREIAGALCSTSGELTSWRASMGALQDEEGNLVDEVVLTYFAAPRSYTAEDVVEISCHGAPVILRHCVERAMKAGARLADPGEFTLRAFLNGRIDLPQAEAVRDLIDATTLYQAKVAAQQAQGSVSRRVTPVKSQLIELISLLEAGIDFAEDDISVAPAAEILRRLDPILADTRTLARSFLYGNLVRSGFSLAIVGRPNAGKSSLFNRLLEQDRAIVTDIPGTTRDTVTEIAELEGIPVRLADTAGIRETTETVERLGIERSIEAMADSDLTIVVIDGCAEPSADDDALIEKARSQGRCLVVLNKCDLPGFAARGNTDKLFVSASTGQGIPGLRQAILEKIAPIAEISPQEGFITSVRQKNLLNEAIQMLERAREAAIALIPHEMLLLDLYCALQPLDSITGVTTGDDILQKIFNTFCIGK